MVATLESTQDAIDALESYLEVLYERAVEIADKHWDFIYTMDEGLSWDKKSRVFLRCRKVGNSLSFEWYETRWTGAKAKGNRKPLRVYLSKPRESFGYNLARLTSLARDWEREKILETEAAMEEFRREAHGITRALLSLRPYAKRLAERGGAR